MRRFDVVILGAGSAGEALAGTLVGEGRSVAVVTDGLVGGECPYLACMPSKALLRSASVRATAAKAHELGGVAAPLDLGDPAAAWAAAVARRDDVADHRDDSETADELREQGVELLRGRGRLTGTGQVRVELADGEVEELEAGDVVLATGSRPVVPPIDGIDDVPTWTSDEALSSAERPERLLVLGGGPIGCELSLVYARFGVAVTLVESSERLLDSEEPEVSAAVQALLSAEGVTVRCGGEAEAVEALPGGGFRASVAGGDPVQADRLLVVTGRQPNVDDVGLDAVGVEPEEAGVAVDERCRVVGAERLWAVGDCNGVAPYTHSANHQADVVADALLGRGRDEDRTAIPRCVYTEPAVAAVGLTRAKAEEAGIDVVSATFAPSETARSASDGTMDEPGAVVLVADRAAGVLIGAGLVGPNADEVLGQLTLAIRARIPLAVLADVVQAFPTYGEMLTPPLEELAAAVAG